MGAAERPGLSVLLEARAASARGSRLLLTRQRADGSWAGDPLSTAQVLIGFANAPALAGDPQAAAAIDRAAVFLQRGLEEACRGPGEAAGSWPAEGLAAAITALVRRDPAAPPHWLAQGRAALLSRSQPVALADGAQGVAFAPHLGGAPDVSATCAAVDAVLLTDGLAPVWGPQDRAGTTAYLRAALADLLRASADGSASAQPDPSSALPFASGPAGVAAVLARALLALGASPELQPLSSVLDRLARSPPISPAAAFAAAEALSLAGTTRTGWPDRQAEAILGAQQGDGGWAGAFPEDPRDRATALALRALQVALGRYLDEATPLE